MVEEKLPTTKQGMQQVFGRIPRSRIATRNRDAFSWVRPAVDRVGPRSNRGPCARNVRLIARVVAKDDSTRCPDAGTGWHESIPTCWDRCDIAVRKRKSI